MAKQSGLGDNFYLGNLNISGDVGSVDNARGGVATLDVTGIDKSAMERLGGARDGNLDFSVFWNPGGSFGALRSLTTSDVQVSYFRGQAIGSPAASCIAKQLNYDGTRADDGAFTFKVNAAANGFGLEWGRQLTAGVRSDVAATNGTGLDTAASAAFGAQAYIHVFTVVGTSVVVKIQDSADNVSFADVAGLAATAITPGGGAQRLVTSNSATIRRYVRVVTTGTFTSAVFAVNVIKNEVGGQVF
jgi:hypothetical protein